VDQGTHDEFGRGDGLYKTLYELKNVDPACCALEVKALPNAGHPAPRSKEMSIPGGGMPPGMSMHDVEAAAITFRERQ